MADFDIVGAKNAGYSDSEIADYLGGQSKFDVAGARKSGYSDGEIIKYLTAGQSASTQSTADDIASKINTGVNWLGTRLTNAAADAATTGRSVADLVGQGAQYVGGKLGAPEAGKQFSDVAHYMIPGGMAPTGEQAKRAIYRSLAPEVNSPSMPITIGDKTIDAGKIIDAGAEAIPGMLAGGAGMASKVSPLARAATSILPGALAGAGAETAGQLTQGTPYEIPARLAAGAFGALAGGRFTSPIKSNLSPNAARAVEIADATGTPLSISQRTGGGKMIERLAGRFPTGSKPFENLRGEQNVATNRAAFKEAGLAERDRTDPMSMGSAYAEAKNNFGNSIKQSDDVTLKPDFYNQATDAVAKYNKITPANSISPIVKETFDNFFDTTKLSTGSSKFPQMTGEQYQSFRKDIGDTMDNLNAGSGEFKALKAMRNALDDAMEASNPPDKAAAIKEARRQWGNMKILLKAASRGTSESRAEGNLSNNSLTSALRQSQGDDKFATTTGGLNDVAHLKQYLADSFPNSGTPTVSAGHAAMGGAATLAGEHGAAVLTDPKIMAAAAALLGGPRVIGNIAAGQGKMLSPLLHKYLANQAMVRAHPALYGLRTAPFALAPMVPSILDRRQK